jgi:hypothetical protein
MLGGSIFPQRRDRDEVMVEMTTFEKRISEIASKIERLEEAFDETRASKKGQSKSVRLVLIKKDDTSILGN